MTGEMPVDRMEVFEKQQRDQEGLINPSGGERRPDLQEEVEMKAAVDQEKTQKKQPHVKFTSKFALSLLRNMGILSRNRAWMPHGKSGLPESPKQRKVGFDDFGGSIWEERIVPYWIT